MPVQRFTTLDAARRALWVDAGDPDLAGRLRRQWTLGLRLNRCPAPRGLRKFRTIEDANAERDAWVRERISRIRSERAAHDPG
jgi:hypothetical protein